PARLHREQPCRFAQRQDHGGPATPTHPVAQSPGLHAKDPLPPPKIFLLVRLSAGRPELHRLRLYRRRHSSDPCNPRAKEATSKLRLEASTPNEFASPDHFGVVDLP